MRSPPAAGEAKRRILFSACISLGKFALNSFMTIFLFSGKENPRTLFMDFETKPSFAQTKQMNQVRR